MKSVYEKIEVYERALIKISELAVDPMAETQLDRIKRLKSIAEKALSQTNQ